MRTTRSVVLLVLFGALVSSCQFLNGTAHMLVDVAKAQGEMVKTFGVPVNIKLNAPDVESAREAKVTLANHPAGLTELQVERDVNIVMHRYVPRLEKIEVFYSR